MAGTGVRRERGLLQIGCAALTAPAHKARFTVRVFPATVIPPAVSSLAAHEPASPAPTTMASKGRFVDETTTRSQHKGFPQRRYYKRDWVSIAFLQS